MKKNIFCKELCFVLKMSICIAVLCLTGCNRSQDNDKQKEISSTSVNDDFKHSVETEDLSKGKNEQNSFAEPEKSLVYLRSDIDETHYAQAGGFVIKHADGCYYICTNQHVMQDMCDWNVTFWDGTSAKGAALGVSDWYDVGIIAVKEEDVADETKEKIVPVMIDMEQWYALKENPYIDVWMRRIGNEGLSDEIVKGTFISKLAEFQWGNGSAQSLFDLDMKNGDSGLGIFDQDGRLVSMVYGTSYDEGKPKGWGIPLDVIVSCSYKIIDARD